MFTQSWRSKRKKKWLGWVGRSGEERLAGEQGAASGARPPDQAPRTLAAGGQRQPPGQWPPLSHIKPCLSTDLAAWSSELWAGEEAFGTFQSTSPSRMS